MHDDDDNYNNNAMQDEDIKITPNHILVQELYRIIENEQRHKDSSWIYVRGLLNNFFLSWWGMTSVLSMILFWVDYGVVGYGNSIWRGFLVFLSLVITGIMRFISLYRLREEKFIRVTNIVTAFSKLPTVQWSNWRVIRFRESQLPSVTWTFRSGEWLPVPDNFLLKGETIMLQYKQIVPVDVALYYKKSGDENEYVAEFKAGEAIRMPDGADPASCLYFENTALPKGGFIVKVQRSLLPDAIRAFLVDHFDGKLPLMLKIQRGIFEKILGWIMLVYVIVALLANIFRYVYRPDTYTWSTLLLARQASVMFAVLPLMLPMWEQIVELWSIAKIVSLSEKLQSLKEYMSKVSANVDNEERRIMREGLGRQARREVSTVSIAAIFLQLLMRLRSYRRNKTMPEDATLTELLRFPLNSQTVLETLGSVTTFACLDERTVISAFPSVEEVAFLEEDQNIKVLDLYHNFDNTVNFETTTWQGELASLKPIGLGALLPTLPEYQVLYQHNAPLPPSTNAWSKESLEALASRLARRSQLQHFTHFAKALGFSPHHAASFVPIEMIRIVDNGGSGIKEHARTVISGRYHRGRPQLSCLILEDTTKARRGKRLPVDESQPSKRRRRQVQSETTWHSDGDDISRKTRRRKKRMSEADIEPTRRNLHMMCWGDPKLLVPCCTEYWAGQSIWPLREEDQGAILSIGNRWDTEDMDGVAFAYTPVSHTCSTIFPSYTGAGDLTFREIFLNDQGPGNGRNQQSLRADRKDLMLREILSSQVFTGMVGSREQPRSSLSGLIEDLGLAGIRFVHFSPRDPRRSFVMSDKMGLETNWNSAISLKEISKDCTRSHHQASEQLDEEDYRVIWDEKAQLPHGIAAIREHLENIDDVPIRVSTFTDSTPPAVTEMIGILREYHDVVLAVGSAMSPDNVASFKKSDIAIGIQPNILLKNQSPAKNRVATPALRGLEVSSAFTALHCGFILRSDASLSVVGDMLSEARILVANYRQCVHFMVVAQLTIATSIVLAYLTTTPEIFNTFSVAWYIWIQIPLLGVPLITIRHRNMASELPPKRDAALKRNIDEVAKRYIAYDIIRMAPTAFAVVVIFLYELCYATSDYCISDEFWGGNVSPIGQPDPVPSIQAAMQFIMTWFLVFHGLTFAYRYQGVFTTWQTRFASTYWWSSALTSILIQIAFNELYVHSSGADIKSWLTERSTFYWVWFAAWPVAIILLSEITKQHDNQHHIRYIKRLRILFETRLGMYSPK